MTKPFRWSLSKREQLGSWPSGGQPPEAEFLNQLRKTTARIIAMSDGANLAFIGRSPENFFDYLSGVFAGLNDAPHLHIIQYSLRWAGAGGVTSITQDTRDCLFACFRAERFDPAHIAESARPVALVDFLSAGGTMETLIRLLKMQARQDGVDWNAVQRKLRIVGLTTQGKNSPNTWRWQQHQDWLDIAPDMVIKNVSVPWDFIIPMANSQPKMTQSNHPGRWGEEGEGRQHTPSADQLEALAFALHLYDHGSTTSERAALAAEISRTHQIRQPATRALVTALKR
ncbi:MAG: hypothetical protein L3J02_06225 [Henriciella sp.]|nr:hypothetical protein [Henriciella sp.]